MEIDYVAETLCDPTLAEPPLRERWDALLLACELAKGPDDSRLLAAMEVLGAGLVERCLLWVERAVKEQDLSLFDSGDFILLYLVVCERGDLRLMGPVSELAALFERQFPPRCGEANQYYRIVADSFGEAAMPLLNQHLEASTEKRVRRQLATLMAGLHAAKYPAKGLDGAGDDPSERRGEPE